MERISFPSDIRKLKSLIKSAGLTFEKYYIKKTQRGSVLIAREKGVMYLIKIAVKNIDITEKDIIPSRSEGLQNEIKILKTLHNDFMPKLHFSVSNHDFDMCIVHFFDGISGYKVPPSHRVDASMALVKALTEMHALNFVHGDIHPDNILFQVCDNEIKVLLIDLELASNIENNESAYGGKREYLSKTSCHEILETGRIKSKIQQDIYATLLSILSIIIGKEAIIIREKEKIRAIAEEKITYLSSIHILEAENQYLARKILKILQNSAKIPDTMNGLYEYLIK